jgi:hypothetical protein
MNRNLTSTQVTTGLHDVGLTLISQRVLVPAGGSAPDSDSLYGTLRYMKVLNLPS